MQDEEQSNKIDTGGEAEGPTFTDRPAHRRNKPGPK